MVVVENAGMLQCFPICPICFAWSWLWAACFIGEDEFQRISRSNGEADCAHVGDQMRDGQLICAEALFGK